MNLFGEGFDDGGVIEISALGDLCHGEVVFDDDPERVSGGAVEVEAACDIDGDDAAEFGVTGFGEGFTGVVEEQSEVEQERTFEVAEDIAVLGEGRFFGFPDLVEFGEADEGMLVGRVLVIELVLDEAGEFAELGDVFAEETDLVHGPEDGGDVAALVEDFEEGLVDVFVAEEGAIDEGDLVPDHLGEVGAELEAALLEVEEDAHEASGLVAENPRGGGGDGGGGDFETVDEQGFCGLGSTAVEDAAEEGDARGGLRGEGEALFEGASDEVEVAEVTVEILHEPLETDARGAIGVAEAVGDGGLDAAGEDVDGAVGLVVQFVAGAEEEVVGVVELACFGVVDELFSFEFLEGAGAVFEEGHPEEILVIAEAAAAIFDIRFLEEGGVTELGAARDLVFDSGFDVILLLIDDAASEDGGLEFFEEIEVTIDEAGFDEGGFGLEIGIGDFGAFGEIADGVSDFEADIPERVEEAIA